MSLFVEIYLGVILVVRKVAKQSDSKRSLNSTPSVILRGFINRFFASEVSQNLM
jgi:hypothetical protein